MSEKVYSYGKQEVTVPNGQKITVLSGVAGAEVYQLIDPLSFPASWSLVATLTSSSNSYISAAVSGETKFRIDAGADGAVYEVGLNPQISDPIGDLVGTDDPFKISALSAAQGGGLEFAGGTSSTSANAGGYISVVGGTPGATGAGGSVTIAGGAGGATSGAGGAAQLSGGNATAGNSTGGALTMFAGGSTGTNNGPSASMTGGTSGTGATGNGGGAFLSGGTAASTDGTGGVATVSGGAGSGTGSGGAASLNGGVAGTTGAGGAASVTAGNGGATSGAGGVASLTGGNGSATSNGGVAQVVAGDSGGGATGNGGNATITGGAAVSTDGNGGNVVLTAGAKSGTGKAGVVKTAGLDVYTQAAPIAETGVATLDAADLQNGLITITHATGGDVALTVDTGTLLDAAIRLNNDDAFEWTVINLSAAAADTATINAAAGHTLVGVMVIQSAHATTGGLYGNAARFLTRKTAANTFVTYRIA